MHPDSPARPRTGSHGPGVPKWKPRHRVVQTQRAPSSQDAWAAGHLSAGRCVLAGSVSSTKWPEEGTRALRGCAPGPHHPTPATTPTGFGTRLRGAQWAAGGPRVGLANPGASFRGWSPIGLQL